MATYAPTTPTAPTEGLDCELLPFLGESPIGLILKAPLVFKAATVTALSVEQREPSLTESKNSNAL